MCVFRYPDTHIQEVTEKHVKYVPFPGSYWSQPAEDDVGVREGTWEKRSIIAAKRNLGMPNPPDFVSTDDVSVMEAQAREDAAKLCAEAEALLKTGLIYILLMHQVQTFSPGDYDKALVKFTRAHEKSRFGNDEEGATRAEKGTESAEQMRGAWSEVFI